MEFVIDKETPIPAYRGSSSLTEAMKKLGVGHSILIPAHRRTDAFNRARRMGIKITTRKDGSGSLRMWRVE